MNETGIDWTRAEHTLRLHSWYVCGWCENAPGRVCGAHRCSATTAAGTRCRKAVSDENPMYCKQHGCGVVWAVGGETVTCASPAVPATLPDGRRLRMCDQHQLMMAWQHEAGHEAA